MSATLLDVISDMDRRRRLADRTDSDPSYLWQIATGRRRASPDLAREIEEATAELGPMTVRKETLRPDLWGESLTKKIKHRRKPS
jgi:DNA-binding transcriptional regulator YdaS (Cro superfamily)